MLLNLPILTLLLATTGSVFARPAHPAARDGSSSSSGSSVARQIYAKRQTSRDEIMFRRHVKDTVKLVEKANLELPTRTAGGQQPDKRKVLVARQSDPGDLSERKRGLPQEPPTLARRVLVPRQSDPGNFEGRRSESEFDSGPDNEVEKRSVKGEYKKCNGAKKSGYAHYPGWKLVGDDLSGAVPVSPELACVTACNKYGGSCSGIYYDASASRCYLKGTHTAGWDFTPVDTDDATDLIGGCALWSSVVPAEMDAVCCLD